MDVVRDVISKLKGSIHIDSRPGSGTTITLRLPLTLAITQVLVARVGTERVAIPLEAVISAQSLDGRSLEKVGDGVCLRVAERLVPVADLAELLGLRPAQQPGGGDEAAVVITQAGPDQLGLLVQQVLGRHEVVIKSLGPLLEATPAAAGATLLGNRVLLVLDVMAVAALARTPGPAGGIKEATR
jgi:chemotaxis protein histidine kinase CheA